MNVQINTPLKKTENGYEKAESGDDVVGYFAGRVNDSEFIMMVPAGHSTVYLSEPIESLNMGSEGPDV